MNYGRLFVALVFGGCVLHSHADDPEASTPVLGGAFQTGAIGAGWSHSLGLKSDGVVSAWGLNTFGQRNIPPTNHQFVAVSGGGHHSVGLQADGNIVAWGRNLEGQTNVPAPNANFTTIAAGGLHSLGLKVDGSIVAWGLNTSGQTNVPSPNTGFVGVAAGWIHSMGLTSNGVVMAWGGNNFNQLNVPAPNTNFTAIAGGGYHSLGLKTDGSVIAWGRNIEGQLNVPEPNSNFVAIAAGLYHSVGLKSDGSVVVWGDATYNQTNIPLPNVDTIAIAANGYHVLALKIDGTISAWGRNTDNQTNVPTNENFGIRSAVAIPSEGSTTGQYDVLISGYFLGGDITNVSLAGIDVASISSQSSTHILVVAGAAISPGLGDVIAYSAGDGELVAEDAFRYRGEQSITFPPVGNQSVFDSVILTASASSGLPVSYSVLAGPATISDGSNVTFTGFGEVFILAEQDGNEDWYAAESIIESFMVSSEEAEITLVNLSQTFNGTPRTVTASTSPTNLFVLITYDGQTNIPVNAGSYAVTGTVVDMFYTGMATGTLMVAKANQTISFSPITDQGSTTQFTLQATSSSGLPVSFDALTGPVIISGGTNVSFTGPGEVSILANQGGSSNWNPAPTITNTFMVIDDFYYLAIVTGPNGSINVTEGFKAAFSTVSITATPAPYHVLAGWGGDIMPGEEMNNPLNVYISQSKTVTVSFAESTTTGGISIPWLVSYGITNDFEGAVLLDHDDDGVNTGDEYFADTDPFDIDSYLSVDVMTGGSASTNSVVSIGAVVSTNRIYDLEYNIIGNGDIWLPAIGYTNIAPDLTFLSITNVLTPEPASLFRLRVRKP